MASCLNLKYQNFVVIKDRLQTKPALDILFRYEHYHSLKQAMCMMNDGQTGCELLLVSVCWEISQPATFETIT